MTGNTGHIIGNTGHVTGNIQTATRAIWKVFYVFLLFRVSVIHVMVYAVSDAGLESADTRWFVYEIIMCE
jgi:hypothetical protein